MAKLEVFSERSKRYYNNAVSYSNDLVVQRDSGIQNITGVTYIRDVEIQTNAMRIRILP